MKKHASMEKEASMGHNSTRTKEMHGAQSPQEQPLKGMRVLNGGKHACMRSQAMHACMHV